MPDPEADTEGYNNGDGQEYTTNELAIYLHKRARKYLSKCHGQCCDDNCGCCPRLGPPSPPSVHNSKSLITT
tara:strand:- start:799 stop:1014 length:216 start_codon:yes stop_codon:yes gene_type:complete